jgi:hypothetical protein
VVGYDQNEEFSGSSWKVNTAKLAKELGITDGISETTLNKAASRELVAELLFRTLTQANIVTYTPALGYNNKDSIVNGNLNPTVGVKVFGLRHTGIVSVDDWGRPGYYWYTDKSGTVGRTVKNTVAEIDATADASYTVATTECDIASDLGLTSEETFTLYVNGTYTNTISGTSTYTVLPTDTVSKVGAQGTLTEVYDYSVTWPEGTSASTQRIVSIDTFLAQVTKVEDATFDAAGHLKTASKLTLVVYTGTTATDTTGEYVYLTNGSTNYTYTKGQYLLVNSKTVNTWTNNLTNDVVPTVANLRPDSDTRADNSHVANGNAYVTIVGTAKTITGAQTIIWYNAAQHTVGGTTYNDAKWFKLDQAGTDITNHTWYFDSYGNLIGATDIATQYTYGIITSIWWVDDASNGSGLAKATITYMDNTSATITLGKITLTTNDTTPASTAYVPVAAENSYAALVLGSVGGVDSIAVATNAASNKGAVTGSAQATKILGGHLFQFETLANGTVSAVQITDELTTAAVTTGKPAITGTLTVGSVAISSIYTNSNTVYLNLSTTGVTQTITGYNNIATFANATVDYVVGADGYAQYVYIKGDSTNTSSEFMFSNGKTYNKTLKTDANGIQYYEFTFGINTNGQANTIKVLPANAAIITTLEQGVGKLFKISYAGGYATSATEVTTATNNDSNTLTGLYLGDDTQLTGDVLKDINAGGQAAYYNVTSSTVVIGGTKADLEKADNGLHVYVVYPTGNANDVSYIYIANTHPAVVNNTLAGAKAAINALTFTAVDVVDEQTSTISTQLTTALLAQANAELAAKGITAVKATAITEANTNSCTAGVAGTAAKTGTFTVTLTLTADNTTDTSSSRTVSYKNLYSQGTLTTAITNAVESVTFHTDDTTAQQKDHVNTALTTLTGTAGVVVNSITVTGTAGDASRTVTVNVTYNGSTFNVSATVTVSGSHT